MTTRTNRTNSNYPDMLDFYLQQYDNTIRQINTLQDRLDGLQECINYIYFQNENIYIPYSFNNFNRDRHSDRPNDRTSSRSDIRSSARDRRSRNRSNRSTNINNSNINNDLFNNIPINNNPINNNPINNNPINSLRNSSNEIITPFVENIWNSFLNNVPIIPTREQIENATQVINYNDISNPLNDACPISLERFSNEDSVTQITSCGHIFNSEQLTTWFQSNVRCPVCRHDIRNGTTNNTTEETSNVNNASTISTNIINLLSDYVLNNNLDRIMYDASNNMIHNNPDRIVYDASNNMILFETTIPYYRISY